MSCEASDERAFVVVAARSDSARAICFVFPISPARTRTRCEEKYRQRDCTDLVALSRASKRTQWYCALASHHQIFIHPWCEPSSSRRRRLMLRATHTTLRMFQHTPHRQVRRTACLCNVPDTPCLRGSDGAGDQHHVSEAWSM